MSPWRAMEFTDEMALYAIGDVQGCYDGLQRLLEKIRFDPTGDRLWFTGDLVNRGPRSADVIRLVTSLGDRAITVLGNHDLHLLAVAEGVAGADDPLNDVLRAPDREALLSWVRTRPLFHHDPETGFSLVHAGLLPQWSIADASTLAGEAARFIAGPRRREFFSHMYGDAPDCWRDGLTGWDRMRLIVNGLTRIRFCYADGTMDHRHKGPPAGQASSLMPWFMIPDRRSRDERIVFGHWSALGLWCGENVIGLDTGCVWGGRLTAVHLDDARPRFFAVPC